MNTERPDNDDEARPPTGGAPGSGGASEEPTATGPEPGPHRPDASEPGAGGAGVERKEHRDPVASGPGPDAAPASDRPHDATPDAAADRPAEPVARGSRAVDGRPGDSRDDAEPSSPDGPEGATPGPGAAPEPDPAPDEPVVGASPAPRPDGPEPSPRRRSPVLIASVAAAVLLVGGGGAYLAAGASGGSDGSGGGTTPGANGDTSPPPLALDGYSEDAPNGIAPGEPNPYGAVYRADGTLPDGPGAAPVYRIRGEVSQEQVVTLAEALGLEGEPVAEGGSWRIGGKDGSGPTLRVDQDAPGAWTFSRNTPGTDNCKGATCKAPSGGGGPVVSEDAAKKAAAPVLKAAGQDEAKLDADQVMGGTRVVNADPQVGGLPTYGWTTGVVVGAKGEVVGGNGRLGEPVKGDSYPVVSAADALKRMNEAPGAGDRAEIGGCASPVPLGGESCATPEPPKGDTVTVGDAVFGLASHSVDGRPALVPSWLFEVRPEGTESTFTVTYPAVDPEFLAPRAGSGEASPAPTKPGDEPTAAPSARDVDVEGYTAEGDELTVTFTGGVCADYKVTASEDGGRVTVRVTETPWPDKVCIMIAKGYQQTVRLDTPLGGREVVGTDGDPVPLHKDGARLPAPPTR